MIEVISPDEVIFNARVAMDDVNDTMAINLPTDISDTLAGLIYSQLGRVPVVGDQVTFDEVELTVLSVAGRRIKKVKAVRRAGRAGQPEPAAERSAQPGNVEPSPSPAAPNPPIESETNPT
jgi:CBS domain containing-hemolysin-like protein